jgi:hypothetical protein
VNCADVQTHTRVGCRELAREWRVETDWEMKEPEQHKQWYCVGQRVGRVSVEFSDEICYRLVREIVTFVGRRINS